MAKFEPKKWTNDAGNPGSPAMDALGHQYDGNGAILTKFFSDKTELQSMGLPQVWSEPLGLLRADSKILVRSVVLGLAASVFTILAQAAWNYPATVSAPSWFQDLGLPTAWIEVWKPPETASFLSLQYYFHSWQFIENWMFWAAICVALFFVLRTVRGELPCALLPVYVLGLSWARIQLEFQMAISAMGSIITFARIDPFSYAQITAYFAMALLLFPVTVTLISRLPFTRIFRLSTLGFPIILMPPFLDNYVLRKPVIYNFFGPEFYQGGVSLFKYVGVVSLGIKLEIVLVAASTFVYLLLNTRSILRSAAAVLAVVLLFVSVSTPVVAFQLGLILSQPQLFAGYLIMAYMLALIGFNLAKPTLGRKILRRIRLRGIHFPAMALFGSFLTHPAILATSIPGDIGEIIVCAFIVILVWQTASVFDDIYDRDPAEAASGYLPYGLLIASMAVLAAVPFGFVPWLLTLLAAYLAIDYPRLRRKHFLLSGLTIGAGSSLAFLFGGLLPLSSPASSQPIELLALAVFVLFSGGSLLKDVASVEEDRRAGIATVFTRFERNKALPIVAAFVAAGMMLPAIFLGNLLDILVFVGMGAGTWLLIVLAKDRCYRPVLVLYFILGAWIFFQMFMNP
jgi:4-hydroxybenzoate polyprenyltransferase